MVLNVFQMFSCCDYCLHDFGQYVRLIAICALLCVTFVRNCLTPFGAETIDSTIGVAPLCILTVCRKTLVVCCNNLVGSVAARIVVSLSAYNCVSCSLLSYAI